MPAAIQDAVTEIYRTVVAAIGRGVGHSAPRHLLRANRESAAAMPALRFDMKQARADSAGTVVIGVPVVVGGCLLLFFMYWFIFLRDRGEDGMSVVSGDAEEPATVRVEELEAAAVPAPRGPAIWVEHMKYRESKSFVLPHESIPPAHPAFGCNGASFGRSDKDAAPTVIPVYRKQNSNFLPPSSGSVQDNKEKGSHTGKTGKHSNPSNRRRSRSGSSEDIRYAGSRDGYHTPPPEEGRAEHPSAESVWRRGAISFTEAVTSEQKPGAQRTPSQRRRRASHGSDFDSVTSQKGNFFDVTIHPHDTPARHHRHKRSPFTDLSTASPKRSYSPSQTKADPKRAHTPPGHEKLRPAVLEYLLGESAAEKAKAREDARKLAV